MFQSLSAEDRQLQIQMGLDATGSGNGFVARNIAGYVPADQSVQVCLETIHLVCYNFTRAGMHSAYICTYVLLMPIYGGIAAIGCLDLLLSQHGVAACCVGCLPS